MLLHLFEPFRCVLECLLACDVIRQEYAVRPTVEDASNRSEGLLASSVPYLQLDYLLLDLHDEGTELNSDCHLMLDLKIVVHYACKQAALPHT